jgi:hypothetical protein
MGLARSYAWVLQQHPPEDIETLLQLAVAAFSKLLVIDPERLRSALAAVDREMQAQGHPPRAVHLDALLADAIHRVRHAARPARRRRPR